VSRRQRLAQTRAYRAVLRRLTPDMLSVPQSPALSNNRFSNVPLPAEVIVYFPDDATKLYQLEQWLPVFQVLHERCPVLLVTRNLGSFRLLQDQPLPLVFVRRLQDLNHVLQRTDARACLYVNNSSSNFQVLSWSRALHLHLNHGESDKISMASNQAKAYDHVLVAGPAAVTRYTDNLLQFDSSKLVHVGRPQLDLTFAPTLPPVAQPTVLYAPTWEGETPAMNYTSLVRFGPRLVASLLEDGFRVVYKPHPKIVTGSPDALQAHEAVCQLLTRANADVPQDQHNLVELARPILSLFDACDVLVSDVSSVALDWLFLRTEAPLWLTDTRDDPSALVDASPLAAQTHVLSYAGLTDVAQALRKSMQDEEMAGRRTAARNFYFGDLERGESTELFLATITEAVERCRRLLGERHGDHHDFDMAAGVS